MAVIIALQSCFASNPENDNLLDPGTALGLILNIDRSSLKPVNFSITGSLNVSRCEHSATLLNNGRVLIVGGRNADGELNSAEIYDPTTGSFTLLTNTLNANRTRHTAAILNDGRVLISGGYLNSSAVNTAEIFDSGSAAFSTTGNMVNSRLDHTLTRLSNNNILAVGGGVGTSGSNTAEIYSPGGGTWSNTGIAMAKARTGHTATLRADNTVLIAGGSDGMTAEAFNATASSVSTLSNTMTTTRSALFSFNRHTATLLTNNDILFVGGSRIQAAAETWNRATDSFTAAGELSSYENHRTVRLQDGTALTIGGATQDSSTFSWTYFRDAQSYNINGRSFSFAGRMHEARRSFTATLLNNGQVLVVGGCTGSSTANFTGTAELYTAP